MKGHGQCLWSSRTLEKLGPRAEFPFGAKSKIKKDPGFAGPWKTKVDVSNQDSGLEKMAKPRVDMKFEVWLSCDRSEKCRE